MRAPFWPKVHHPIRYDKKLPSLIVLILYIRSCIEKWIARARKDTKAKCPQCKYASFLSNSFRPQSCELFSKPLLPFSASITKKDIRPIWAKQLVSVDSCKIEQLQNDFDALRQRHQEQEIELSKLRLAYQMCRNELTRKDAEIKRVQLMLNRYVSHTLYS